MKRLGILLSVLVMVFGISAYADAAVPVQYPSTNLWDMGDGTIYDTDTQLSWLKDAGEGGLRNWLDASTWAFSLDALNSGSGYAGLTGWRLPSADTVCYIGLNCVSSEMGHLFYTELGNSAGHPIAISGPFTNLLGTELYWTNTEFEAHDGPNSWDFNFYYGAQGFMGKNETIHAWAVRPGYRSTDPATPVHAAGTTGLIVLTIAGLMIYVWRFNMKRA